MNEPVFGDSLFYPPKGASKTALSHTTSLKQMPMHERPANSGFPSAARN
jgi:hypothetical protein